MAKRQVTFNMPAGQPLNESKRTAYQPEMLTIRKDDIYSAIEAISQGIEYAQDTLARWRELLPNTKLSSGVLGDIQFNIDRMTKTKEALKKL